MKYDVRVRTNARKNEIRKTGENSFAISVTVPPVDGKANDKVIELIAGFLGTPKRKVTIIRGLTSKRKVVDA
jgi:uncharacterized protein YggU (UPF0235/DUF167 family)